MTEESAALTPAQNEQVTLLVEEYLYVMMKHAEQNRRTSTMIEGKKTTEELESLVLKLSGMEPKLIDEPQAYKRTVIRMAVEAAWDARHRSER